MYIDVVQVIFPCVLGTDVMCIFAGTTPQRKEYVYPHVLSKPRRREELEDEFRAQQEQLQCALSQCETVIEAEDEKHLDQVLQSYVLTIHILELLLKFIKKL